MKVWVTRDRESCWEFNENMIRFWTAMPDKTSVGGFSGHSRRGSVNIMFFKSLFKFTPRKGSCKQMELELKEAL
jgi:hypothetical protein